MDMHINPVMKQKRASRPVVESCSESTSEARKARHDLAVGSSLVNRGADDWYSGSRVIWLLAAIAIRMGSMRTVRAESGQAI